MLADGRVTPENDVLWAAIEKMDLSFYRDRVMESHTHLAREAISYGMRDYKQFLYLLARYPRTLLVPSKLTDLVWHEHILDTQNYENDCARLTDLGGVPRFIHHNPRVMPGTAKHGGGVGDRNRLLQLHFGLPHPYDIDRPDGTAARTKDALRLDVQCDTEGFGGSDYAAPEPQCGGDCA